jgi:hypothetical protein
MVLVAAIAVALALRESGTAAMRFALRPIVFAIRVPTL